MVRALASHQCGPGSIPGLGVICGLSSLLVLVLAPRGFSPGTPVFPSPQKPTFPNSNSIWTQWKKSHPVDPLLIPIYFLFILFLFTYVITKLVPKKLNTYCKRCKMLLGILCYLFKMVRCYENEEKKRIFLLMPPLSIPSVIRLLFD